MKVIALVLLVVAATAAYNTTRARNLAYACAATFSSAKEIEQWNCPYCHEYKLTNVVIL